MHPRSSARAPVVLSALLSTAAAVALWGCGPPDGAQVTPEVTAGCEDASDALRQTNQFMLPGRVCEGCHRAGGQATNSPFTLSGTIFAAKNSPCNNGGVDGKALNLFVDVQDANGVTQPNGLIPVNSKGNFYSASTYKPPLKITVYQLDSTGMKKGETPMNTQVGYGVDGIGGSAVGCATCHQIPGMMAAPGRISFTAM